MIAVVELLLVVFFFIQVMKAYFAKDQDESLLESVQEYTFARPITCGAVIVNILFIFVFIDFVGALSGTYDDMEILIDGMESINDCMDRYSVVDVENIKNGPLD